MTIRFDNLHDARTAFAEDRAIAESLGIFHPGAETYVPEPWKRNYAMAMDAQPQLSTVANSAIPSFLTQMIDPEVYEILFSPNKGATIFTEQKKGDWLTDTAIFPISERGGEVSSYGDYSNNGHSTVNVNWPQRQSYLFQTIVEYGERELERAGLGRINWVSEQNQAAALALNKFSNLTYFFGVAGLQNYGMLNDPGLTASLTPSLKAYGGTKWIVNGVVVATANEIYQDIQAIWIQLVAQNNDLVDADASVTLAMSPTIQVALTATNSFNVNVFDLLKKNFPNIRFATAVQYGQSSASNNQGIVAGNLVQMIVDKVEGQRTGYVAFNEKMRAHKIIPGLSSYKQKQTSGTWGGILRYGAGIASMLGV